MCATEVFAVMAVLNTCYDGAVESRAPYMV